LPLMNTAGTSIVSARAGIPVDGSSGGVSEKTPLRVERKPEQP
jgi:hypothetical protein